MNAVPIAVDSPGSFFHPGSSPKTEIEFLKAVRADPRFERLPFIMVTVETKKARVVEALRSGVSDYVTKPFNQKVLKEKIDAALASNAA